MTSPIEYLVSKGFRITSDPNTYASGIWGYRDYHYKGVPQDDYCDGYHRAYDLSDYDGAPVYSVCDGVVVDGTGAYENFGGTVVIVDSEGNYQYIYGHLKRNLKVKIGDTVKQGDVIGYQGNTNYNNIDMASHLHFQVQCAGYIPDEKTFVCTGIRPDDIDVSFYAKNQKGNDSVSKASYKIIDMRVPTSKYNIKSPYRMQPETLTIHNTANTAPARNEASYMRTNNNQTSFHVVGDDKEVVQCLPFSRIAWAAGDGLNGPGNRRSIHYEICYSMDNGYSGSKSQRYHQAELNAIEYAAHVLHQYGWKVNKLRQHWDWTRKDCPHKVRATLTWNWMVRSIQDRLNVLNGTKGVSPTPTKPKQSTSTSYTVKRNDTLWGIASANGMTVKELKNINNLKTDTIHVGQTLRLEGESTNSSSAGRGTGGAGNIKYKWNNWKTNKHGTHYVSVDATFVVGDTGIWPYENGPFVVRSNRAPSIVQPGKVVKFYELRRQDGYVWGTYKTGSGRERDLPIKKWNGGGGRVTNAGLFGRFIPVK